MSKREKRIKRIVCLLSALLLLMAVSPLAGCRSGRGSGEASDTERGSGASPDSTQSSPEAESDPSAGIPPSVSPRAIFAESLTLNDRPLSAEGEELTRLLQEGGYTVTLPEGTKAYSLTLSGWVGYDRAIDCFGYRVDGEKPVFGFFEQPTEEAVKEAGGAYARRFAVTVPLFDLDLRRHTVTLLVRLNDGVTVELFSPLSLRFHELTTDLTIPYHASLTHVNGKGPDGSPSYTGADGSTESGPAIIEGLADGVTVSEQGIVTVSGWVALEGGVAGYAWSADGETWHSIKAQGHSGEPAAGAFSELGYTDAAKNALMRDLTLDLSLLDSHTVDVTLGAIPNHAAGRVVPFAQIRELWVPDQLADIDFTLISEADCYEPGTNLVDTSLLHHLDIAYGAGDPREVTLHGDRLCYELGGIHAIYTPLMDGRYGISAEITAMSGTSFMFTRGYYRVISDSLREHQDPSIGRYLIHNFYETDGAGAMGGAGIYARLSDGVLTLMIKYYDPNNITRVGNALYHIPCEGETLTMLDDGYTVEVLVDGECYATVVPEGSQVYADVTESLPRNDFAKTATITLKGGETHTLQNTLIAATLYSQCGLAVRGGTVTFSSLSILPLTEAKRAAR